MQAMDAIREHKNDIYSVLFILDVKGFSTCIIVQLQANSYTF